MMEFTALNRRNFVKGTCYAAALSVIPGQNVFGQTLSRRLDWNTFKTTPQYPSFVRGIARMRSNTNATDRKSWAYWTRSHLDYCPHGIAYFLAWHRGYLHYFEQYLRFVSGDPTLMLPYWDWNKNPNLPAEFTNRTPGNPLYVDRVNTNVSQALTLAPFSNTLVNFQRGLINSFESSLERRPHDPVHDIIGAVMATMQSPRDPIFCLHHANIDRLWAAWVLAGNGRTMPANNSTYWSGQFTYGPNLTMARYLTSSTRTYMRYMYQNESLPTSLRTRSLLQGDAEVNDGIQATPEQLPQQEAIARPPVADFPASAPRPTDTNRRSVGGSRNLKLHEKSVSTRIRVDNSNKQLLKDAVKSAGGKKPVEAPANATIQIVLDDIQMTAAGQGGGYFYHVFLNMPERAEAPMAHEAYLLGSVGAFAVAGALHHAKKHNDHARGSMGSQSGSARLVFPATRVLANISPEEFGELTVSFVRVSGDNSPQGETISVGELRVEISDDDLE